MVIEIDKPKDAEPLTVIGVAFEAQGDGTTITHIIMRLALPQGQMSEPYAIALPHAPHFLTELVNAIDAAVQHNNPTVLGPTGEMNQ